MRVCAERERDAKRAQESAKATATQGLFCGWDEIFFKSFQFWLVTGYFFFSPPASFCRKSLLAPWKGEGGGECASWKGEKKKTRHEISSTPFIPCPHTPAFHTHTPPCSMCDHPCPWTEPSRTFQNVLHGIRKHIHARTCTPLPSAQYTHRFYCDVRGCIDSPVDKLDFFLCCLSLSLSPRQY